MGSAIGHLWSSCRQSNSAVSRFLVCLFFFVHLEAGALDVIGSR